MSYDDDWETDPNFENKATEEEQRWGKGVDRGAAINMQQLIEETEKADDDKKKKLVEESGITGRHGYGGKFGVEKDRMDKSALGHDYLAKLEKHASQKDYAEGFGGKFGVSKDRMDKSAVGFDYVGKVEKHDSQADYKKGFGGKFGIETERMDKSAHTFQEQVEKVGTNYQKVKPDIMGAKPSNLKSRFENIATFNEEETKQRAAIQKKLREEKDIMDKTQAAKEHVSDEPSKQKPQRKAIVTGRNERISDVINVFNAPPPSDEFKPAVKQPIKLPKEDKPQIVETPVTPDIISSTERHMDMPEHTPVAAIAQQFTKTVEIQETPKVQGVVKQSAPQTEPVESQPDRVESQPDRVESQPDRVESQPDRVESQSDRVELQPDRVEPQQQIYENIQPPSPKQPEVISEQELIEQLKNDNEEVEEQFVLSPDNPGVTAIALYDYQAAADDEISFDPDDLITHIDMIDAGWWKGLHAKTYTYGLFPANYVQLREYETKLWLLWIAIFGVTQNNEAVEINCKYSSDFDWFTVGKVYTCSVQQKLDALHTDSGVIGVNGVHIGNRNNNNVEAIRIYNRNVYYFSSGYDKYFTNIEVIQVFDSKLKVITQKDLKPFTKLKHIDLSRNDLEELEKELFKFNELLLVIKVNDNKLKFIDVTAFEGLFQLHTLELNGNHCIWKSTEPRSSDDDEEEITRDDAIDVMYEARTRCYRDYILKELYEMEMGKYLKERSEIVLTMQARIDDLTAENEMYYDQNRKFKDELDMCLTKIINKPSEDVKIVMELSNSSTVTETKPSSRPLGSGDGYGGDPSVRSFKSIDRNEQYHWEKWPKSNGRKENGQNFYSNNRGYSWRY